MYLVQIRLHKLGTYAGIFGQSTIERLEEIELFESNACLIENQLEIAVMSSYIA